MTAEQNDERDTVDIEEDTEDVQEDVKSGEPTEPDLSSPRKPHRIRMPSKGEIARAVDQVKTESLNVDEVTREAAKLPKAED